MNLIPRHNLFDVDSLFSDFFTGIPRARQENPPLAGMRVDVHETDDCYEIHADLPGVNKDDIHITLDNDLLTIAAKRESTEEKKDKGKVIWQERSSGSISRSFSVRPGLKEEDIKAQFNDGVLTLNVPKPSAALPEDRVKRIPVE